MPDGRPGQRPADHGAPIPHTASRTVLAVLRKWNVGTAIAIMLWIYFTAAILLFGAVIYECDHGSTVRSVGRVNRPHKKSGRMQASAQRSPGEGAPSG